MREFVFVSDNKTMNSFLEASKGDFTENIVSDPRTNGFLKDLAKKGKLLSSADAKTDTVRLIFFPEDPKSHTEVINNFNETFKVLPDVNVPLITIAYERLNALPPALVRSNDYILGPKGAIFHSEEQVLNRLEKELDVILKQDPAPRSERRQALYDNAIVNEPARLLHKRKDSAKCETFTYISTLENMEKFEKMRQGVEVESTIELDGILKRLAKCKGYVDPARIDENTLRIVHYPKDPNKRAEVSKEFAVGSTVLPNKNAGIIAITQDANMESKDLPPFIRLQGSVTIDSGSGLDMFGSDRIMGALEGKVVGFAKSDSLSKEKGAGTSKEKGAAANFEDFGKSINSRTTVQASKPKAAVQASKPKPNVEKKEGAIESIKRFFKR